MSIHKIRYEQHSSERFAIHTEREKYRKIKKGEIVRLRQGQGRLQWGKTNIRERNAA